jgi:cobalamin biosynthesis Co2+ chelatase CbiK
MERGMLFVSFGTSHEETRKKTIDAIQETIRETFPDCTPYSAWTSGTIIKKVKEEYLVDARNPTEVDAKVKEWMDGTMYDWKITKIAESKTIAVY